MSHSYPETLLRVGMMKLGWGAAVSLGRAGGIKTRHVRTGDSFTSQREQVGFRLANQRLSFACIPLKEKPRWRRIGRQSKMLQ